MPMLRSRGRGGVEMSEINQWDWLPLGKVATLQRGYDLPSNRRKDGEFPIISSGGVTGWHSDKKQDGPGVVTGRYGSIGEVYWVDRPYWPLNTTLFVSDFHSNHPPFIYQLLKSLNFSKLSGKTGVPGVNRNDLHTIKVLRPPRPEQLKIAKILRTWDEAIEKLNGLRIAYESRLLGLRDSLMARASRQGRPACFGDFLTESRIPGSNGATARKISVRLYGKGTLEKNGSRSGSANTRYYRRKTGQIIWSKLDFLNGAFALIGPELDGCESTLDLPAFDCDPSVNPAWLIEYLTRPAYYTRQIHLARGQRKARRVAPDDWLASPLRLPDRATQDHIADILSCARKELSILDAEIDAVTRQKRGLMQKLLTGEWRVAA